MAEQKLCQKCGRMMDADTKFYTYKNGDKTEMCKNCLTMHIDNFDPNTFLWLLEKMDVPYLPEEWNSIRDKAFAKNPNLNGTSVFGKYLSKMKLNQFRDKVTGKQYGWADTDRLNEQRKKTQVAQTEERVAFEEEIKQKYENGEIGEAEYKTLISAETQNAEIGISRVLNQGQAFPQDKYYNESTIIVQNQMNDLISELTQEDKISLAMKWGAMYKPDEWIMLEKDYTNMTNSFDIQDADTTNTLILICKTNLKMNQCLDNGDIEGYQKLSKVSESLRKSAKFTAAQNKEQKNDFVDSVGELVAMCEREGFIPRYATDIPQDKIDLTLKDMNTYVNKLVTEDLGFGQQIEDALKKIQIQKEMGETDDMSLEEMDEDQLVDKDYEEFYASVEEQRKEDEENVLS
jgi:hypothetical protein